MRSVFFRTTRIALAVLMLNTTGQYATADLAHGIAMYGDPALPPDFVSLPYANPDAPKGGRIVTGNVGGFDSLNPFVLKGTPPWQLRFLTHESLMGRSWDEPFTLYGLLAESVETGPNREWVEFTLRPRGTVFGRQPRHGRRCDLVVRDVGHPGPSPILRFLEKGGLDQAHRPA